jgi:hypothetical protein
LCTDGTRPPGHRATHAFPNPSRALTRALDRTGRTLVAGMGGGRPFAVDEAVDMDTPDTAFAQESAPVSEPERVNRETKIRRALLLILTGAFVLRLVVFLLALPHVTRTGSQRGGPSRVEAEGPAPRQGLRLGLGGRSPAVGRARTGFLRGGFRRLTPHCP